MPFVKYHTYILWPKGLFKLGEHSHNSQGILWKVR
ncbi:hypothetical protein ABIA06_003051 [Bradyrhizobium yuanmingense]